MGAHHLTGEATKALQGCDYLVAAQKADTDHLLALRRDIAEAHGVPLVAVADPPRDRDAAQYVDAVRDWHHARARVYEQVLRERGGIAGFAVWGDPSLYDSTIRILDQVGHRLPLRLEVFAGVSTPQLLAARHRIVLHEVGGSVLFTTARRLPQALRAAHAGRTSQPSIVVMLGDTSSLRELVLEQRAGGQPDQLGDWHIWWGANIGTTSEQLLRGRVGEVLEQVDQAAQQARSTAGWAMQAYLLRRPA
ncbi:MAG: precorrin-6A synthase (deacetylating) [Micrococcales bacterium]|nr:MAG: precorrin-6A synthase (deacetylating) [Micrococcales bacterium]PIE26716.1 MAG: precorrin-6A synthase (deacetylating) [Micrococcales bacterium]